MKRINMEAAIQSVILGVIAVLLAAGLISGKINKYVHPRFNIGLWISVAVLVLFIGSILSDRKRRRHNTDFRHYLVYLVPILLAIVFPPIAGNTDIVLAGSLAAPESKQGTDSSGGNGSSIQDIYETEPSDGSGSDDLEYGDYSNVLDYLQGTEDSQSTQDTQEIQGSGESGEGIVLDYSAAYQTDEKDGYFVIDDAAFGDWFMDMYDHLEDFTGEKYQFLAQVFPMEDLKENQFLAGRNFMICCAADLTGYGLICESDLTKDLKENEWIIVKATISKCEYNGAEVPLLINTGIEKTKAPKEEYIYYNNY